MIFKQLRALRQIPRTIREHGCLIRDGHRPFIATASQVFKLKGLIIKRPAGIGSDPFSQCKANVRLGSDLDAPLQKRTAYETVINAVKLSGFHALVRRGAAAIKNLLKGGMKKNLIEPVSPRLVTVFCVYLLEVFVVCLGQLHLRGKRCEEQHLSQLCNSTVSSSFGHGYTALGLRDKEFHADSSLPDFHRTGCRPCGRIEDWIPIHPYRFL